MALLILALSLPAAAAAHTAGDDYGYYMCADGTVVSATPQNWGEGVRGEDMLCEDFGGGGSGCLETRADVVYRHGTRIQSDDRAAAELADRAARSGWRRCAQIAAEPSGEYQRVDHRRFEHDRLGSRRSTSTARTVESATGAAAASGWG